MQLAYPEPSDAWLDEVWQILLDYGGFESEVALLEALQDAAHEAPSRTRTAQ